MEILKSLYGIPEAGTHWWVTYINHQKEKLQYKSSTYDPCLLITNDNYSFGVGDANGRYPDSWRKQIFGLRGG